jgi:hypothetical protein
MSRIAVRNLSLVRKIKRPDLIFISNVESKFRKIGRESLFRMNRSSVCLGAVGRQYVQRPVCSRYDSRYQIPTVKRGGGSLLVWGVFSVNGLGPLVHIEGIMNGPKYKEILKNNLLPYPNSFMPEEWIFQHENDPKRRSKVVKDWLESNRIQVLKWPAQSRYHNSIERYMERA